MARDFVGRELGRIRSPKRIIVFGASGTGCSTLGFALSQILGISLIETDDLYWDQKVEPFTRPNSKEQRQKLTQMTFATQAEWVLAGSVTGWSEFDTSQITAALFLSCDPKVRVQRITEREIARFGRERLFGDGDRAKNFSEFIEWTKHYDLGDFPGRSRPLHETWVKELACPVLSLDTTESSHQNLLDQTLDFLGSDF
jgi:adenylate kinase family enzyme